MASHPTARSLSCCESLSFFPPLIKQQRLLSSSAKGAQMRASSKAEEQSRAEQSRAGRKEESGARGCSHKPSQNSRVDMKPVCRRSDAFMFPLTSRLQSSPIITHFPEHTTNNKPHKEDVKHRNRFSCNRAAGPVLVSNMKIYAEMLNPVTHSQW